MKRNFECLLNYIESKPSHLISLPAVLCFVTFIVNIGEIVRDGKIEGFELHQLLATADGFESVVLFIVMLVLRAKKK